MSKLAFLIPNFDGGGAERVTIRLAAEFARRGHEVELVAFRAEGKLAGEVPPELTVTDLGVSRFLAAPLALRAWLRRSRPEVVTSALFSANTALLLARALSPGCRSRIVVTERTALSVQVRFSRRLSRHLFKPTARLLYRFADAVVGISSGVADDIQRITRLPRAKVSFIHNPAWKPELEQLAEEELLEVMRPREGEKLICTVGRFEPQKDQATLIRAFARMHRGLPSRLVLPGYGSLEEDCKALARELGVADRVLFPGFVRNPLPLMKAADLFVLPSRTEGFGNALVEAMACGTSVVATDCPFGPGEILDGGRFGALVPVGDDEALAEAMLAALRSPQDPDDLKARAREFSLNRCADRYAALYESLSAAG